MQLFSSPKPQFPPFLRPPPPNPNPNSFRDLTKIIPLLRFPLCSTKGSSHLPLQEQILCSDSDEDDDGGEESEVRAEETAAMEGEENDPQEFLAIRRPVKDASQESVGSLVETEGIEEGSDWSPSSKKIDLGLTEFAKKMPIFEPERAGLTPEEKPLAVNLELSLYRSKILARNFQFKESEKILRKCILFWPEDGRAYVALGKILVKQSKFDEARSVYERGCQASQGENPYIWQCWAVLENKVGNTRRARELFDAATVADKKHVAAWHGWAILEIKQGNIKKARNLLGKGLKYCGGNEYIYQTLALLEAKGNRFDQARYLFWQATQCNPKSCASWLAWAQVEMQQERYQAAIRESCPG